MADDDRTPYVLRFTLYALLFTHYVSLKPKNLDAGSALCYENEVTTFENYSLPLSSM